jgi:Rrf2 family protein
MSVSAKALYACIAMLELAEHHGNADALVQVKTIADTHNISQRFLVQILLQLKAHGLVRSARGAAGGYQLAQLPENISMSDVIHAIDQEEPATPSALKKLRPSMVVQAVASVLQDVDSRQRQLLRDTSLAELVRRAETGSILSYQI